MKITSLHRTYDDDDCNPLFVEVAAELFCLFCHPRALIALAAIDHPDVFIRFRPSTDFFQTLIDYFDILNYMNISLPRFEDLKLLKYKSIEINLHDIITIPFPARLRSPHPQIRQDLDIHRNPPPTLQLHRLQRRFPHVDPNSLLLSHCG